LLEATQILLALRTCLKTNALPHLMQPNKKQNSIS
jgi:hypothetical protein